MLGASLGAASTAELFTFPSDVIKTRMQVGGGDTVAQTVRHMLRDTAGFRTVFYGGFSAGIARHLLYTPMRVHMYSALRPTSEESAPLLRGAAAFTAGGLAQLTANPADTIKVRVITSLKDGRHTTLVREAKQIFKAEGLRGFWVGATPAIARGALVNMGELATYDSAKMFFSQYVQWAPALVACSTVTSGCISAALSTPADVVRTRIVGNPSIPRNPAFAVSSIVRREGVRTLWRGFFPTWARLSQWQFMFWGTFELFRHFLDLPPFGSRIRKTRKST